jgi:hypothetical protein
MLRGDKGGWMQVWMDIQAGWRPIGHGIAEDSKGRRYHLDF